MTFAIRALLLATVVALVPRAAAAQDVGVLHIRIVLVDADGKPTPVARHALLVSDNPATVTPRRVVTALDGTVDIRLRPGNYTIESDEPVRFRGKAYHWIRTLDIAAGRDARLELTADNAEIEALSAAGATVSAPLEDDPWLRLPQWKDSVVALWTPIAHASGVVVDANGLVATSQRAIGTATAVEVQLTPALKVAGHVVVADPPHDVALIRVDARALESAPPVPLGCSQSKAPVVNGQRIFTISVPLRQEKSITPGAASGVGAQSIASDFALAPGSAGGPVFTAAGDVVGITSVAGAAGERSQGGAPVFRIDTVCEVITAAEKKLKDAAPPAGTHLPVEPPQAFSADVLENAARTRAGTLNPYQLASSEFDIAFITPVMVYGAHKQSTRAQPLMDFSNWSDYVADFPTVLLVRVTPKFEEGFWAKVARGAAQTQGMALPAMKRFKSGFSRMRAFCGDAEITPIHPFRLEHRVSENDVIDEGFYVFDPDALGPSCTSPRLVLYSEKEPDKGDTRAIDANVLQQIWRDFAPYRASR